MQVTCAGELSQALRFCFSELEELEVCICVQPNSQLRFWACFNKLTQNREINVAKSPVVTVVTYALRAYPVIFLVPLSSLNQQSYFLFKPSYHRCRGRGAVNPLIRQLYFTKKYVLLVLKHFLYIGPLAMFVLWDVCHPFNHRMRPVARVGRANISVQ